jgi:nuclear transport factor 2 (NTF2) superfamily protein
LNLNGTIHKASGTEGTATHCESAPDGVMQRRDASIDDVEIQESDRRYR